jgi:hypothetical protein
MTGATLMHQAGALRTASMRLAVLACYLPTTQYNAQEKLNHDHEHDGNRSSP